MNETSTSDVIKVVIVSYNSRWQIGNCLASLLRASEAYRLQVFVVDNGSDDGTPDVLREHHPEVFTTVSSNLGFAHGCNQGVRAALELGGEYAAVLYLNPDAIMQPGSLDRLMDVLLSSPEVGAVSPQIVLRTGQVCDRLRSMFGSHQEEKPLAGRDAVVSDRLHGCCMLVRSEALQATGSIDEDYFLYWEEMDFGLRMMKAGFRLLLCYDVLVEHGGDEPERSHRIYYMWRNQFRFAQRNFPPLRRQLFLLRRLAVSARELAGFVVARRIDLVMAAQAGLLAGLRGETGKSANRYALPKTVQATSQARS